MTRAPKREDLPKESIMDKIKAAARNKRRKRLLEASKHGEDRNYLAKQLQLAKRRIRALEAYIAELEGMGM